MTRNPKSAQPRKGMPSPRLGKHEFKRRFLDQFQDPAFSSLQAALSKMAAAAWDGYSHSRKSPRTLRAGEGYADPDYRLAVDWINAADAIRGASQAHRDHGGYRILLINGSSRSEHTCPGEMSKSYRLALMAKRVFVDEQALSMYSTCRAWLQNMDARFTPAKHAFQHPRLFAIGRALVIPTTLLGGCTIG
jgi:hypothetical protein